jgi:solute carrier family 25 carnitine/acylcarnitine transporter 20/29
MATVKLQLQRERLAANREFKSPIDCVRQIVRAQGVSALWTGLTGSLAFRANLFWLFASFEALMRGFSRLKETPFEVRPSN